MSKKYDLLIFIGRFQPFHYGHKAVIEKALSLSDKVLILLGSTNTGRTLRNPFLAEEREEIILAAFSDEDKARIHFGYLSDFTYNDMEWVKHVQEVITKKTLQIINNFGFQVSGLQDANVGLIGCSKDESSYYLNLFPMFKSENVEVATVDDRILNSTDIRNALYERAAVSSVDIPLQSLRAIWKIIDKEEFEVLRDEYEWTKEYHQNVHNFPRIEQTVDAIVVQSGHVLLVKRRYNPGKGKLALPGGFLNQKERIVDGALRELREETKIKVPEAVLRGHIVLSHRYDDPNRSERGRVITDAFLIKLDDGPFPKVKGADDAEKAMWVPLTEITPHNLFEDHYFVIMDLIRRGG